MKSPIVLPDEAGTGEDWYRFLVETARDVIFTLAPDGTFTSLNPAFEATTGRSRAEWLGKPFMPLLSAEDLPKALDLFHRILDRESPPMFELNVIPQSQEPILTEFLVSPQVQDGKVVGILGIARDVTERKRTEEARLRAEVAEAAQLTLQKEIAERQRVEEQLLYRLTLEESLAEVSNLFTSTTPVDLNRILQVLGEAVRANRSYLFLLREDGRTVDNTHEWCDSKTESWKDRLQGLDAALFPWWKTQVEKGAFIVLPDIRQLPDEAGGERALLEAQGIRSLLAVPVNSSDRQPIGFLGFDDTEHYRTWLEEDVRLLRVASEMLSNFLTRTRAEKTLREKEERLEAIFRAVSD